MKNRNLLRVMSFMFALLIVASSAIVVVPFTASAADANTIEINTVDDLYAFANTAESNGWYAGKTVKLNVNIDLEGAPAWTPVAQFKGTFDGNGKTIKNLKIEGATTDLGFFKVLDGATVKNFRLEGSVTQTAGNGVVAVLAARTSGAAVTIDNVYVGGTLNSDKNNTNCFRVGGFVGYVAVETTIKNSVSAVNIQTGYKSNAGFVGANQIGATLNLTDCAFIGFVDAGVNVESGAFVGRVGGNINMTRCIKLGFADDQTGRYEGTFMYFDNKAFEGSAAWTAPTINIVDCYTTQAVDAVVVVGDHGGRAKGLYNLNIKYGNETVYTYAATDTKDIYLEASAAVKLLANKDGAIVTKENFATTCPGFTNWVVTNDTVKYQLDTVTDGVVTAEGKTVPVIVPKGIYETVATDFVVGNFGGAWAPDANGVFTVRTVDDLHDFSAKAAENNFYAGKTVKLAVDIDLTNETWTPVPEFKGTFDGNGRTIKGLVLNGTSRLGFFDKLDGATIKDFHLDGTINELEGGTGMMGLLAVETVGAATTIENVYVTGGFYGQKTTNKSYRHGGMIGYVAADTTITKSASGVTLYDGDKANGGFVGATKYGTTLTITDCAYYGAMAKQMQAESGGIIGRLGGNLNLTRAIVFGYNRPDANSIYNGALFYLDTKSFETNGDNATVEGFVPPVVVVEDCYVNVPGTTTPIIGAHSGRPKYNLTVKYGSEVTYTTPADGKVVCADATAACKTIAIGADVKLTKENFATLCPGFTGWVVTDLTAQSVANAPVPVFLPKGVTEIKPGNFVKGESIIEVATADELLAAAEKIVARNGFAGKAIELTADIDMTGKTWTMVDKFSGTLDGNGFAIKNLQLNTATDTFAMFKVLDGAVIKNLIIEDVTMTASKSDSKGMFAILATETSGEAVTIENVYIGGTMTLPTNNTSYRNAGFVAYSKTETNITKCVSAVNMTACFKANSGFVGAVKYGSTLNLTDCAFTGNFVDTVNAETGAFVGRVGGNVNMLRCVKLGYCKDQPGQYNGAFMYLDQNDFDLGNKIPENWVAPTITIEDCFTALNEAGQNVVGGHGGRSTAKYNVVVKYNGEVVCDYKAEETNTALVHTTVSPTIKTVAAGTTITLSADTLMTEFKTITSADWVLTDKNIQFGKTETQIVPEFIPEAMANMLKRTIVGKYTVTATPDWKADANGVFNIATAGDLLAFAANAEANGWYNGKAVQLTADIDMKKIDFVPLAKFMGYFEGNGYTIKNLTVNQKAEPLGGLINVADGMTMKNVIFLGCSVTLPEVPEGGTGSMVGGIVGNTAGNFPCTFENIYIDSTIAAPNVSTAYRVGGLIGNVSANPDPEALEPAKVTIKNCVSAVTITSSYKAAAGFIGSNAFGTLVDMTDCAFIGRFVKTNAENAGFIGRVVGSVNLTRCINLSGILNWGSQWSGSMVYLDNNDFVIGNTYAIASMIPSEVNLVDCYSVAPTADIAYTVGAHGSRFAYKLTISYTGDTAPAFTNATVENFKVDYAQASKAVKTVAIGETATLTKDNLATVCPTFTGWKTTDETVSFGTNMNVVKILPTSVAAMLDGTFVKGTIPTDIPEWKLPEPPVENETTTPGGEGETTAPTDDTTAVPGDDTTATPDAETTKKDEETTAAGKDDNKKGCGSVVGGSIAVIIAIAGGAMFLTRKKED